MKTCSVQNKSPLARAGKAVALLLSVGFGLASIASAQNLISVDWDNDVVPDGNITGSFNGTNLNGPVSQTSTDGVNNGGIGLGFDWQNATQSDGVPGINDPGIVLEGAVFDEGAGNNLITLDFGGNVVTNPIFMTSFVDAQSFFEFVTVPTSFLVLDQDQGMVMTAGPVLSFDGNGAGASGFSVQLNGTFSQLQFIYSTTPVILDSILYTIAALDIAQPASPAATPPSSGGGSGGGSSAPKPIMLVDQGAIISALTTGLDSISTTLDSVQNAAQNATLDVNDRIFRARAGGNLSNGSTMVSADSTSRYLQFAQNQNIDYRVALGLEDGEDVEIVSTLPTGFPLSMAGAGVPVVAKAVTAAGYGAKNPIADKVVVEDVPEYYARFTAYSSFDYGFYDLDKLTSVFRGSNTDSYAGSIGLEYHAAPWINIGGAFSYIEQDTNLNGSRGSNDLDGQIYSIYTTLFHGNSYLDILYSYGDFDNGVSRNTLLGRFAHGDTDSQSHNVAVNIGHTFHATDQVSFGPFAAYNYTQGDVDGYTERNGGRANLIYPDHDFDSSIGRLGGFATFRTPTSAGDLTTQVSAGWAHDFDPDSGNVSTGLQTSPFALVTSNSISHFGEFSASQERAHPGTDWLELGVTTRLDIQETGWHVELGYQGMFGRSNASGHFGSAKLGLDW